MKYPYIGGIDNDCKTLFLDECYGIAIEHNQLDITGIPEYAWSENEFTNITHEYLKNTYGEVKSPEHAEFIIELAKNAGIDCVYITNRSIPNSFTITDCKLMVYRAKVDDLRADGMKQITIPLPPKTDKKEVIGAPPESLNFRCVMVDIEWAPNVGDEVKTIMGEGVVKLPPDEHGYYTVLIDGKYIKLSTNQMKKPKTPEEELRDNLEPEIKSMLAFTNYNPRKIAEWIISGEIDGLSYSAAKKA